MKAGNNNGRLTFATRQLRNRWEETRTVWRDAKALEFEETYIAPLLPAVASAIRAMEELDQLIGKIHADCE